MAHNIPLSIALAMTLTVLTLLLLVHDVVPLGRWNNAAAMRKRPLGSLVGNTVLNTLTGLVPAVCAWMSLSAHGMSAARLVILITMAVMLLGEITSWWLPWLRGTNTMRTEQLAAMTAGTISWVPARNGVLPNALHCTIHLLTVTSLVLVLLIARR